MFKAGVGNSSGEEGKNYLAWSGPVTAASPRYPVAATSLHHLATAWAKAYDAKTPQKPPGTMTQQKPQLCGLDRLTLQDVICSRFLESKGTEIKYYPCFCCYCIF